MALAPFTPPFACSISPLPFLNPLSSFSKLQDYSLLWVFSASFPFYAFTAFPGLSFPLHSLPDFLSQFSLSRRQLALLHTYLYTLHVIFLRAAVPYSR